MHDSNAFVKERERQRSGGTTRPGAGRRARVAEAVVPLLALGALTGCATTPLQTGFPAESIGAGRAEAALAVAAVAPAGGGPVVVAPAFRGRYGLSDRWDLVVATELETFTVLAKWTGWQSDWLRVAPLVGGALVAGDFSWTVGAVIDVPLGAVTPYGVVRYQVARVDTTRLDRALFAGVPPERFDFLSVALGFRWRWTERLALGLETVVPIGTTRVRWNGSPVLVSQVAFSFDL